MSSQWIDLRSDTVTRPTPAMREAMFHAVVGDDVYGEDPTVNRLERLAAEVSGKEAALFVPTGTMGNTIAIKLLTQPGQEVICDVQGHVLNYELSMTAWFSGCLIRTVEGDNGILTWDRIAPHVRPLGPHWAPTGCIELENTHNMGGGTLYPQDVFDDICAQAHARGLRVHLDGARIFNAAAASACEVSELCRHADTVMFCLSKGLGAPVGSMLAGPKDLIDTGRLYRKRLGGGMRQAGVLAAADSRAGRKGSPGRASMRKAEYTRPAGPSSCPGFPRAIASRSAASSSRRLSRFCATAAALLRARRRRNTPAQDGSDFATESNAERVAPAKNRASASEFSRNDPLRRAQAGARDGSEGASSARIIFASVADGGAYGHRMAAKAPHLSTGFDVR